MRMARVLVVADNLYILGSTGFPPKADPPLIVDPDRMLPGTCPAQSLQSIAWRRCQRLQLGCGNQGGQPPLRRANQVGRKSPGRSTFGDGLSKPALE
jgi:hypothetical protein